MSVKHLVVAAMGILMMAVVAACGGDPTATPTATQAAAQPTAMAPSGPSVDEQLAQLRCDRQQVGTVVRCTNFYTEYWPLIEQKLKELHKEALEEEGGEVISWSFTPPDPERQKAFSAAFPGMKITGQGFQFGTSAALIAAAQAGKVEADATGGSALIWRPAYKAGAIDTSVDWTKYGLPSEFLDPKNPGMLFSNTGGHVLWYNAKNLTEADVPANPWDYLDPKWKGRVASSIRFYPLGMAYIAIKFGEAKTDELAKQLIDQKIVTIVEDPGSLVVAGEYDIAWPSTQSDVYHQTRAGFTGVLGYQGGGVFPGHSGIVKGAKHPKSAMLSEIWAAFDPDWITTQFTEPKLQAPRPYLGIPTWPDRHIGLQAILDKLDQGWYTVEDSDIVDEVNRLTAKYRQMITAGG